VREEAATDMLFPFHQCDLEPLLAKGAGRYQTGDSGPHDHGPWVHGFAPFLRLTCSAVANTRIRFPPSTL